MPLIKNTWLVVKYVSFPLINATKLGGHKNISVDNFQEIYRQVVKILFTGQSLSELK